MRNTTISSSIASVVSRVIDSVVVAGSAVRNFHRPALMGERALKRENMGYWQESYQLCLALGTGQLGLPGGKPAAAFKPAAARHCDITAMTGHTSLSTATSVRRQARG